MDLSRNENEVLKFMKGLSDSSRVAEDSIILPEMTKRELTSAVSWLQQKGLVAVETEYDQKFALGSEGRKYLAEGLPELQVLKLLRNEGSVKLDQVFVRFGKERGGIAITQLAKFGIKPKGGRIIYIENPAASEEIEDRQKALEILDSGQGSVDQKIMDNLKGRGDLLEVKKIGRRYVTLTDKGRRFEIHDSGRESIEEIDSKVILSGRWKWGT